MAFRLSRLLGHLQVSGAQVPGVQVPGAQVLGAQVSRLQVSRCSSDFRPKYSNAEHPVLQCRKTMQVLDVSMSYLDTGGLAGQPTVVFLHGNPTSAYLWRNVILEVSPHARCLAPDLPGHGRSGPQPQHSYKLEDHYRYLDAWLGAVVGAAGRLVLVGHDWGNGLAFYWANMNRGRVAGLAYMEAAMAAAPSWKSMTPTQQQIYGLLRSPAAQGFMDAPDSPFVDSMGKNQVLRTLNDEELKEWMAPFLEPGENRRPIVDWCREVPIRGDGPENVLAIFNSFRRWLAEDEDVPKLYIDVEPGMLAPGNRVVVKNWKNQRVVKAKGLHFCQEDDPVTIGRAVAAFVREIRA